MKIVMWPKEEANHTYLLSHPSSGNHWARFIIEWFSGSPTQGCMGSGSADRPIFTNTTAGDPLRHVDGDKDPVVIKSHNPEEFADNGKNRLITIVRNYKECIGARRIFLFPEVINRYMAVIHKFDEWSNDKLLIYYEDLMTNPSQAITGLTKFLNIYNKPALKDFMDSYEELFDASLNAGGRKMETPTSKGRVVYHTKRFSAAQLTNADMHVIENNPPHIIKYIERYLEDG